MDVPDPLTLRALQPLLHGLPVTLEGRCHQEPHFTDMEKVWGTRHPVGPALLSLFFCDSA